MISNVRRGLTDGPGKAITPIGKTTANTAIATAKMRTRFSVSIVGWPGITLILPEGPARSFLKPGLRML
jgi:hypothetical protein